MAELFLQVLQYLGWQWNAKRYGDITGVLTAYLEPTFFIWEEGLVVVIDHFSFTLLFIFEWLIICLTKKISVLTIPTPFPGFFFFSHLPTPLRFRFSGPVNDTAMLKYLPLTHAKEI